MLLKYLRAWIMRAAENSVMLTDKLTILLVPFSTLIFRATGYKITDSVQETLALGVAITVVGVVVLRLIAASYWLWRDDQIEKGQLAASLASEKSRPDRLEREAVTAYTVSLRSQLSDGLAELLALTEVFARGIPAVNLIKPDINKRYSEVILHVRALINALSYDTALRICSYNLTVLCTQIVLAGVKGQPIGDDWSKMTSLRRVTFRLLHKKDSGEMGEILSMLEAQNIMEGVDSDTADDTVEENDSLQYFRQQVRDPETASLLRDYFEAREFKEI